MYKELDELIELIKQTDEYQAYVNTEKLLYNDDVLALLQAYQSKISEYNEIKNYEKYIDLSDIKDEIKKYKNTISDHMTIQKYYDHYYQLNNLLDEITDLVFNDIDDEIINNRWKII